MAPVPVGGPPLIALVDLVVACIPNLIVPLRHVTQVFPDVLNPPQEGSTTVDIRGARDNKMAVVHLHRPILLVTLLCIVKTS